jgi:hypothetical protein
LYVLALPRSAFASKKEKDPPLPPLTGPCKCDDLPAIVNRMRELAAAQNTMEQSDAAVRTIESRESRPVVFSDAQYLAHVFGPLKGAMDAAFEPPAPRTSIPLRGQQCSTEVVAPSACLQPAAKANSSAYQTLCAAGKPPNRLTAFMEWERAAAQAELAVLFDQVRKIGESCPFKDWTGTVRITVTEESSSSKPVPNPAKGRDVEKNASHRVATILVLDGRAVGEVKETTTLVRSHTASGQTTCAKNTPPVPFTESREETSRVQGDIFKPASVTVAFNKNQYKLSAATSGGWGSAQTSVTSNASGGCGKKAATPSKAAGPSKHAIDGISGGALGNVLITRVTRIEGSMRLENTHAPTDGGTLTRTKDITWALRRAKPHK